MRTLMGDWTTDEPECNVDTDCYIDSNYEPILPFDVLEVTVEMLNKARTLYLVNNDKRYWWHLIRLLPSSYNQKRTVMMNYEVLANIYKSRKNHRLDEWRDFCKWVVTLSYNEIITGEEQVKSEQKSKKSYK